MAVTQKDIADTLRLSRSFVTRVLANAPGTRVSDETRQLIARTAQEMGYRPNLAAKSVREKRFYQIGVVASLPFIHPLAWHYIEGINKGLIDRGYAMSLIRLTDVESGDALAARAFQGHMLDGLIGVVNVPQSLQPRIEALVPNCVWLNTEIRLDERCIHRDEVAAIEIAVQNLKRLGYRKLTYMRGEVGGHVSLNLRHATVARSTKQLGVALTELELPSVDRNAAIACAIKAVDCEAVILAVDGYLAQEIEHVAVTEGIKPGRDFALASCDDTPGEWGDLTRISFPRVAMGEAAADMVLSMAQGENAASKQYVGEWVAGATAPRVE